jgi:hypothetical protein
MHVAQPIPTFPIKAEGREPSGDFGNCNRGFVSATPDGLRRTASMKGASPSTRSNGNSDLSRETPGRRWLPEARTRHRYSMQMACPMPTARSSDHPLSRLLPGTTIGSLQTLANASSIGTEPWYRIRDCRQSESRRPPEQCGRCRPPQPASLRRRSYRKCQRRLARPRLCVD